MSVMDRVVTTLDQNLFKYRFHLLWTSLVITILYGLAALILGEPTYPMKDILLNYADGMVRRGLAGSAMIGLSQIFGGQPVFWAWLTASFITALNCWLAIGLYKKLPNDPAFTPLILAPYGIIATVYEFEVALRKEILGYLAILLVLKAKQATERGGMMTLMTVGASVFLVSLFAHEAIIFMWPVFALALWLLSKSWPQDRGLIASIALGTGMIGTAIVTYLFQLPLPDNSKLCEAARIALCDGPFDFLAVSIQDGKDIYMARGPMLKNVMIMVLAAIFCLYPMSPIKVKDLSRVMQGMLVFMIFAATLPLYYVAYDWDRWLIMILYPLSLIGIVAITEGDAVYETPLSPRARVAWVSIFSIPHGLGTAIPSLVRGLYILPALGIIACVSNGVNACRNRVRSG